MIAINIQYSLNICKCRNNNAEKTLDFINDLILSIRFWSFQVVLQRANLRPGEENKEAEDQDAFLQVAQLVAVTVLLAAV